MKSVTALIFATIFWGLNFHFAKLMLEESSFMEAEIYRYAFGVAFLLFFALPSLKKNTNFSQTSFKGIFLVCFIGLFGFNMLFFSGMQFTSPLNAALIVSLNPITTILFSSVILKTKIYWYHIIGASISLIGVLVLLYKGELQNLQGVKFNLGDLLIFGANIAFALHHVWVKKYKGSMPNLQFTGLTNLICLLGLMVVSLLVHSEIQLNHSLNYWLWAIGIGVFGTGLAYILWNKGISEIGADKGGIFMNIVPLATAIGSLFLGMEIFSYHLISGGIIISGILLVVIKTNHNKCYT